MQSWKAAAKKLALECRPVAAPAATRPEAMTGDETLVKI